MKQDMTDSTYPSKEIMNKQMLIERIERSGRDILDADLHVWHITIDMAKHRICTQPDNQKLSPVGMQCRKGLTMSSKEYRNIENRY